jgi:hypothetical protein
MVLAHPEPLVKMPQAQIEVLIAVEQTSAFTRLEINFHGP